MFEFGYYLVKIGSNENENSICYFYHILFISVTN